MSLFLAILYGALFAVPAFLIAGYYSTLLGARLLGVRAICPEGENATHRFAIVIPAHNEENVIAGALQCCDSINYPTDKYHVFVIADNCVDRTVDIVQALGDRKSVV